MVGHGHGAHSGHEGGPAAEDADDHQRATCDAMPCCTGVMPMPCEPGDHAPEAGAGHPPLAPFALASHRWRPDERPPKSV
jgi:hypothetical protein